MIEIALEDNLHLPNVSVQKLLYMAHASHLVRYQAPLVTSVFEAWEFGPVCRPVYDALKHFGRRSVDTFIETVDVFTGEIVEFAPPRDRRTTFHIESTMTTLGRLSPGQLISLTHAKGGAWEEVWNKNTTRATAGGVIGDILTVERFSTLIMTVPDAADGDPDETSPIAGD